MRLAPTNRRNRHHGRENRLDFTESDGFEMCAQQSRKQTTLRGEQNSVVYVHSRNMVDPVGAKQGSFLRCEVVLF